MSDSVLVLNSSYVPVFVTSFKHSMRLLFRGKAEIISVEDGTYVNYNLKTWADASYLKRELEEGRYRFIETENSVIGIPKVIRLLKSARVPTEVRLTRKNIFLRDDYTCQYCGTRHLVQDLNLDHVNPKSKGGRSIWENLVCSCIRCNAHKRDRTPKEADMHLLKQPTKPGFYTVFKGYINKFNENQLDEWKHFFPDDFISEAYWDVELEN